MLLQLIRECINVAGAGIIDSLTDPEVLVSVGVPAILGLTTGAVASAGQFAALAAATAEATALSALQQTYDTLTGYQWGIFPNKKQTKSTLLNALKTTIGIKSNEALFPDAVVYDLGLSTSAQIAQALLEGGSFMAYNKTINPKQVRIGMSFSGTSKKKAQQLAKLQDLQETTKLVSVKMPSYSVQNMNVIGFSLDRSPRQSSDLMLVDVMLQEARAYAETVVVGTKNGTTASQVDTGSKQTQSASSSQSTAIESGGLY